MWGENTFSLARSNFFCRMKKKTFMCMEQLLSHSPPFVTFLQKRPFIWCCCLKFTAEGAFCVAAKYSCWGLFKLRRRQDCYFSDSDVPPLYLFALFTAFSGKQHEYMLFMPFIACKSLVYQTAGLKTKYVTIQE